MCVYYTLQSNAVSKEDHNNIVASLMKQPVKKYPFKTLFMQQSAIIAPQNIICPDGTSQCASNNTCCINSSGGYGCCPFPNAVCCPDRAHCCPLSNTCCLQPSGIYTCCPLPNANCCEGNTCCALGYSCNNDGTCTQQYVVCPDQGLCALNNTCCMLQSGGYGCCPLPNAVCCSDDKCCPTGNTCNNDGTCSANEPASLKFQKEPAKKDSVMATPMKQPTNKDSIL